MHRKGFSCRTLFVDLASAFHHLIRELVVGPHTASAAVPVLQALENQEYDTAALRDQLQLPALLERLGASPSLVRLLTDLHSDTWYRLQHLPDSSTEPTVEPVQVLRCLMRSFTSS